MLIRCVDEGMAYGISLGCKYVPLDSDYKPMSERDWYKLEPYDIVYIQIGGDVHTYPKWRFREEDFFKKYEDTCDFDSITLKEECQETTKEAIQILPPRMTLGEFEKLKKEFDGPTQKEGKEEKVNHPQHYNQGKYEVIDVIEDWNLGFNLGNTIKYIGRAGHKDDKLQDLKKALWYLQREVDRLEKQWDEELEF